MMDVDDIQSIIKYMNENPDEFIHRTVYLKSWNCLAERYGIDMDGDIPVRRDGTGGAGYFWKTDKMRFGGSATIKPYPDDFPDGAFAAQGPFYDGRFTAYFYDNYRIDMPLEAIDWTMTESMETTVESPEHDLFEGLFA